VLVNEWRKTREDEQMNEGNGLYDMGFVRGKEKLGRCERATRDVRYGTRGETNKSIDTILF
jgi:hypothetical protein